MIKIAFADAEIAALRYGRFHHPDPRIQVRLEALYLRSQGVANADIQRLCGISKASFHRFLTIYASGGIEALKRIEHYRPPSELSPHHATLEAVFAQAPPATVAEAAARIAAVTGIERKPTQVRQFLRSLGMKPLKVGMIPAKADVAAQETFKKKSGALPSRSPGGPSGRLFRRGRPLRVCPVSGHSLVRAAAVCQSPLGPPTRQGLGRVARHVP
jgi:transposase